MKKIIFLALAFSLLAVTSMANARAYGSSSSSTGAATKRATIKEFRQQQKEVRKGAKAEQVKTKLVVGKVASISDNALTVTVDKKTYTVNVASDAKIVNRNWKKINLSDIEVGHHIRVFGKITGNLTISAETVRDITLPKVTKKNLNSIRNSSSSTSSTSQ